MVEYYIIKCPYCKNYIAKPVIHKKGRCPYCGKRIEISKCRIFYKAKNGREASLILRTLKAKEAGILGNFKVKGGEKVA